MCCTRRPGLKVKHVGGEVLVLDESSGQIHQLNRTATFIWKQCDGKTSPEIIAQRMIQEFEVGPLEAARDVSAAIDKLCELRLLTR